MRFMAGGLLINHINEALIWGSGQPSVSEHGANSGINSAPALPIHTSSTPRIIYSPITHTCYGAFKIYHSISVRLFLPVLVMQ